MANKITVGKIVASANETEWSQAYHAGGFTAVISVKATAEETEKITIAQTGKQLLDTLVSEYFTLTTKDLETIKRAVTTTVNKAPRNMHASLIVAAVIKNVLYIVIANEGKVLLKRGEKLGILLSVKEDDAEKIASVSGFLESNDLVLLYTKAFADIFPHDELEQAFDQKTAEELAEFFAPKVHESQNGNASALVFSYHEEEANFSPVAEEKKEEEPHAVEEKREEKSLPGFDTPIDTPKPTPFTVSHRQKLFITISVILGIVLIGSIVIFQVRQQAAKQQALFASVYNPAKAKYDEAQGLLDVNKSLAIEDLQNTIDTLTSAKNQFPSGSADEKQIASLLANATQQLANAKKIPLLTAQKADSASSPLLTFATSHTGMFITQDTNNFYTADNTVITQYNKKTNASKKLITNTGDWKQIGGFDTYFGNFYVVDTKDGIDKYVSSGSSYGKSAYFASGVSPDLSKAVSMSIDSSVYILTSDGTITKYTKGSADTFAITGLDMPLKNPTEILTSADLTNVYVLDNGNARVVVLDKNGTFVAQYAADQIRSATAIDVSEKNKKLYFLSGGTVYQLDLK